MLVNEERCNTRTILLRSGNGASLTLQCSNIFAMTSTDRAFVLDLLEAMERYEKESTDGPDV